MTKPVHHIPAFANEHVTDFSRPANREAIERAMAEVHAQLGRDYDLLVAGRARENRGQIEVAQSVQTL